MKILCVCHSGNVRSVALARLLRKRGHESIGVGIKQTTLLPLLCDWAERIYPMDFEVGGQLSAQGYGTKLRSDYMVGPDDWKQPDHPDLLRRLRDLVESRPVEPLEPA